MECGYGTIWRIFIKSVGSLSYLDHGKLIDFIGSFRFLYIYSNFDALLNDLLRLLLVKRYAIALLSTKPVLVETYLFLFIGTLVLVHVIVCFVNSSMPFGWHVFGIFGKSATIDFLTEKIHLYLLF